MPRNSDLVLLVLASWRLAFMFVYEAGPFDLVDHFRQALGANNLDIMTRGFWAKLFGCVPCLSFWTTLILTIWWLELPDSRDWLHFLGLWGGATSLHMVIMGDRE